MKSYHNFLVSAIAFGILLLFHFVTNQSIMNHPYMVLLMWILFGVGGYNFGRGLGKMVNGE